MQRQSEAMMEEIARWVREANVVLDTEDWDPNWSTNTDGDPVEAIEDPRASTIVFFKSDGTPIGGFRITDDNIVQQYTLDAGVWDWDDFMIDNTQVRVCPRICPILDEDTPVIHDNGFTIDEYRRWVEANITFFVSVSERRNYHLTVERGVFRCRL